MENVKQKILLDLKQLAKKLILNFKKSWFRICIVTKEEKILDDYLRMCPDPKYNKYGTNLNQRIKNLEKFLASEEMKIAKRGIHGTVIDKKQILRLINLNLANKLFTSLKTKLTKFDNFDFVILVSKPKKEEAKDFYYTLRHECLHVLLKQNNLGWEHYRLPSYCWLVEEGLVTYLDFFIDHKAEEIHTYSKQNSWTSKFYGKAALKWLKILGKQPKKEYIKNYLEILSKDKNKRKYWKDLHNRAMKSKLAFSTN